MKIAILNNEKDELIILMKNLPARLLKICLDRCFVVCAGSVVKSNNNRCLHIC